MSDGNYNRNLLPYHQYASGLRAGKAQMHTLALKAFAAWLSENGYSADESHQQELHFRELLEAYANNTKAK